MRTRARCGFTLLEVLLSLAVLGMLLVALNVFVFSMGELWGRNADQHLFDEHVNAVTRFLQNEFQAATLPPAARANAAPVAPQQITPLNGSISTMLTFDLLSGSRVLSWPDQPALPEVTCSLQWREHEGLFLLWHSRLEMRYADDAPREQLLTPLVTALAYDYYDDSFKKWTTESALRTDSTGQPVTPQRLHLTFTYGKHVRETTVPIPSAIQGVPNF